MKSRFNVQIRPSPIRRTSIARSPGVIGLAGAGGDSIGFAGYAPGLIRFYRGSLAGVTPVHPSQRLRRLIYDPIRRFALRTAADRG